MPSNKRKAGSGRGRGATKRTRPATTASNHDSDGRTSTTEPLVCPPSPTILFAPPLQSGEVHNSGESMIDGDAEGVDASRFHGTVRTQEGPGMLHSTTAPLGSQVPLANKQKIWNGEYIDLCCLLPDYRADVLTGAPMFSVNPSGTISVVNAARPRQIASVELWTDAFLTFMAIYCTRHPDRVQELLKYMSIVRDIARKFPGVGWREYDCQFRRRHAMNPASSFSTIDGELWMTVMMPSVIPRVFPGAQGPMESNIWRAPFRSAPRLGGRGRPVAGIGFGGQTRPANNQGFCYWFNRQSGCVYGSACRWPHICAKCRSPSHGVTGCSDSGRHHF